MGISENFHNCFIENRKALIEILRPSDFSREISDLTNVVPLPSLLEGAWVM